MASNSSNSSNLKMYIYGSTQSSRLEDKVIIITGGASGIGECTARLFAKHGAKVVIGDIQDDRGHSICKGLQSDEEISYVHCDVTKESDVENVVDTTISRYGKLDIMFSNAGIPEIIISGKNIADVQYETIRRVVDVNLFGAIFCAKHAARVMIPAKKGSILFTASVVSVSQCIPAHIYAATKHAVVGLTKNLCVELGEHGIRVNCVSPFIVPTPLLINSLLPGWEKERTQEFACEAANLKGVVLEEGDIAKAALYLASDESKYVSGLNLVVDGGYCTTNVSVMEGVKKILH